MAAYEPGIAIDPNPTVGGPLEQIFGISSSQARNIDPKRPGGFQVYDQLDLSQKLN